MLLLFFVCFWKKYKEMLGNMGKCENVVARPVPDTPIDLLVPVAAMT